MPTGQDGTVATTTRSANSIWRSRAHEFATRAAFRFRRDDAWQSLTWRQADQSAREIAAGLLSLGLVTGDRVALLCQTRLEWLLCDVAIAMAGLVSVPIYPSSTSEQVAFLVGDSGARVVIAEDEQQIEKLAAVRAKHPGLHLVRIVGEKTMTGFTPRSVAPSGARVERRLTPVRVPPRRRCGPGR